MLDDKDPEKDRAIAERVISNHRYISGNNEIISVFNYANDDVIVEPDMKDNKMDAKGTTVYEKVNPQFK
jgi:DNA replicative helicase MCM subunit Mcm2 (Cdc46/Mcm family)